MYKQPWKYKRLAPALAACLLAGAPLARAGTDDDALVEQVKQVATKGQDAQTTAQVNQYVDQNRGLITAILKGYINYLNQIQGMSAGDGSVPLSPLKPQAAPANGPAATGTAQSASGDAAASGGQQTSPSQNASGDAAASGGGQQTGPSPSASGDAAASGGGQQSSASQPAPDLKISGVQASGELRTSHLAGYPALPDVEPSTSVMQPTAAQLEYAAKVRKEIEARKQYLMEHPQGYTY